jgi:transcription elongation factor Elf1
MRAGSWESRKFREKPYTQCFECIQGIKIKCKKCMSALIATAIREQATIRSRKPPGRTTCKTSQVSRTRSPEELSQVSTVYGQWMEKVRERQDGKGGRTRLPAKKAAR